MKKIILTSVAVAGFMLLTVPAHAVDSTGCGLGSVIFKGQKGPLMQILAVTTNSSFGTQTFGITSGHDGMRSQRNRHGRHRQIGFRIFGKQYGAICF